MLTAAIRGSRQNQYKDMLQYMDMLQQILSLRDTAGSEKLALTPTRASFFFVSRISGGCKD